MQLVDGTSLDKIVVGLRQPEAPTGARQTAAALFLSAADLRDDLQRYLSSEPIHARFDSLIYRTRMAVRRHRAALLTSAMILVALIIIMIGTSIGLRMSNQISKQEDELVNSDQQRAQQRRQQDYVLQMQAAFDSYQ